MKEVIDALRAAPEFVNPAIALAVRLQQAEALGEAATVEQSIKSGEAERAIEAGELEGRAVQRTLMNCGHSYPQPSKEVPVGF
jgi:hypothetical protein